jgi:hypothetical protein
MATKKQGGPTGARGKTQFKRDNNGLVSGVDYVFNEDGAIDWRAMVKTQYLVPDRNKTQESDVTKLPDNQLIILLGGIKELAQIRGYTSVKYAVKTPSPDYVVATCMIDWTPNYETEGQAITFSAIGDASPNNTTNFARNYLGPIAENRAFVRCVRNFLKINIVSQEELGEQNAASSRRQPQTGAEDQVIPSPHSVLKTTMESKGVSFNTLKKRLSDEEYDKAEEICSVEDIPKIKVFELIERIKKI